jgi:hypothetical protein
MMALLAEPDEPITADGPDREALLIARALLAAALAELRPKQRLALAFRYVHYLSDAEIAAALGCREGSVHALLSRGRAALRRNPHLAQLASERAPGTARGRRVIGAGPGSRSSRGLDNLAQRSITRRIWA